MMMPSKEIETIKSRFENLEIPESTSPKMRMLVMGQHEENKILRKLLKEYGDHHPMCQKYNPGCSDLIPNANAICTCGWEDVEKSVAG